MGRSGGEEWWGATGKVSCKVKQARHLAQDLRATQSNIERSTRTRMSLIDLHEVSQLLQILEFELPFDPTEYPTQSTSQSSKITDYFTASRTGQSRLIGPIKSQRHKSSVHSPFSPDRMSPPTKRQRNAAEIEATTVGGVDLFCYEVCKPLRRVTWHGLPQNPPQWRAGEPRKPLRRRLSGVCI